MNFNYLLTEDDRYQYYILQYLELNKTNYMSIDSVCEFSGLSKFKVKKYLNQLKHDLAELGGATGINILDNSEITVQALNTLIVKKIRLQYLQRSGIYLLLQNAIIENLGIEAFAKQHFYSKSYTYALKKQLTKLLKEYQIEYRNNELHGDELVVRNFLYTIYYDFYNGLDRVFSREIEQLIEQLGKQLTRFYALDLSLVKKMKLNLFLGVCIQRIQRQHTLSVPYFTTDDVTDKGVSLVETVLKLKLGAVVDQCECDYILTFLFAENITTTYLGQARLKQFEVVMTGTQAINEMIMRELALPTTVEEPLYQQLVTVNLRLALFYAEVSTFTSEHQITFFQESYPTSSRVVLKQLPIFLELATVNSRLRVSLFYQYLFAIIESVPYQILNPAIYVCVDFSIAQSYTHYIEKQIMGFKNLNIILEKKITQKTQLFVSDFAQEALKINQIIWKNPPSTEDWGDFGDLIIQIKKGLVLDEEANQ